MTFVQLIDCKTSNVDQLNRLMDSWVEATQGKRTATHSIVGRDRSDSAHVVEIVEFPSYEEAMQNSNLPETNRIFEELVAACEETPTFTDLDVVRDEQLNKLVVRRFFGEVINAKNLAQAKRENGEILDAFNPRLTVKSMIAEGDLVTCRRHQLTHRRHLPGPAHRHVPGVGAHQPGRRRNRSRHVPLPGGGKIAESWWNWDDLGLLQLGALEA
ncbi:ester cyclase [Streptomyces sp. PSKA01]|uniref:Ester cyclase n=1 Tax=Streptomyces cupreus TaxID=2759956 RepID=A0A7X1J7U1_9ACTN|nr:ester cyclase [Streptomyces cupreus]